MHRKSLASSILLSALGIGVLCLAAFAESVLAPGKAVAAALYGISGAVLFSSLGAAPKNSALRVSPIRDRLLVQGELVFEAAILALLLKTT